MFLKINGVDVSHLIKEGGIKWSRNDVDSADSGRTMDGTMHRARVTIKYRLDVSTMPLSQENAQMLLALIEPQFVDVEYISPRSGYTIETMYSNNIPVTHMLTQNDGTEMWSGFTFPLIQQ